MPEAALEMKKISSLLVFLAFFVFPHKSFADSVFPMGYSHLFVNVGNAYFTDDNVDELDLDNATFFGGGFYAALNPKVYLGLEYHRAEEDGRFILGTSEVEFNPVELNLKYSQLVNDHLVLDLGGGISRTYIEEKITTTGSVTRDGWFHGIQLFAGLNILMGNAFLGFDIKWHTMDDFKFVSYDYNNIRLGAKLGVTF